MPHPDEQALIERYEACRKEWLARCKLLFRTVQEKGARLEVLLQPDEVLDALDEELVRLERQLPIWYDLDGDIENGGVMQDSMVGIHSTLN